MTVTSGWGLGLNIYVFLSYSRSDSRPRPRLDPMQDTSYSAPAAQKSEEGLCTTVVFTATMDGIKTPSHSGLQLISQLLINRSREINSISLMEFISLALFINPHLKQSVFKLFGGTSIVRSRISDDDDNDGLG